MVPGPRSGGSAYLICAVPRTGSWLLCHGMEQSGVAGVPAEYFWRGDMVVWAERWGTSTFAEYVEAFRRTATPNGILGAKLMWGYFDDFLARSRSIEAWAELDDDAVLDAVFGDLRFLWIRRRDKVRQGISWWRAEVTGEWARTASTEPSQPPPRLDLAAVKNLVEVADAHDRAWAEYFASRSITPWTVFYEDLITDVTGHVREALAYIAAAPPTGFTVSPTLQRQADDTTARWVEEYRSAEESGALERVRPMAQTPVEGHVPTSSGADE